MEQIGLWPKSVQTAVALIGGAIIAAISGAVSAPDAVTVASEGLITHLELRLPY